MLSLGGPTFKKNTFIGSMLKLITFDYNYLTFFEHIFEHINGPLSGLFYRTEKCRPEEIRGGAFNIRQIS